MVRETCVSCEGDRDGAEEERGSARLRADRFSVAASQASVLCP